MKPDFIIAGAARAGTTSLADCLTQHTRIYMPTPFIPEPKVFTDPTLPDEDYLQAYDELFKPFCIGGHRPNKQTKFFLLYGEKTVNYLEVEGVAETIGRVLPDIKIIFCLRNPVDRAYSNWCWSWMNGYETKQFAEAISLELCSDRWRKIPHGLRTSPFNYVHRGRYFDLLVPFSRAFKRGSVIIYIFEEIIKNVQGTVDNFCDHFNIEYTPITVRMKNERAEGFPPMDEGIKALLKAYYSHTVEDLKQCYGLNLDVWEF
tara:strand:+ start:10777 stop:11556 length:780 start_codon:yes stop_codon:yes gene_type:complete